MKRADFRLTRDKPDIEIKKPVDRRLWQRPLFTLLLLLAPALALLYVVRSVQ
jgi:hypothetical protein